jgi:ketosteroid isomerase-like protein
VSAAQVEIVREAFESLNRGDLDGALAKAHDDVVFDLTSSNAPYAGVYTATEEARAGFQEFLDTWEHVHWTIEEVFEAGEDQVIAVTVVHGRVRAGIDGSARGG